MSNHYIEIIFTKDKDIPVYFVRNRLCGRLHKALVKMKASDIGISFPEYKLKNLGGVMRLHGSLKRLNELRLLNWIGNLSSFCCVSEIKEIPDKTLFQKFFRTRNVKSLSKLKRIESKNKLTKKDSNNYIKSIMTNSMKEPFIEYTSSSTGHSYNRYIKASKILDQNVSNGLFDTFGLSKGGYVPIF